DRRPADAGRDRALYARPADHPARSPIARDRSAPQSDGSAAGRVAEMVTRPALAALPALSRHRRLYRSGRPASPGRELLARLPDAVVSRRHVEGDSRVLA